MPDLRLPLAADLAIDGFAGAAIDYERGMVNAIIETRGATPYITQRPGIDVFDSPAQSLDPDPVPPVDFSVFTNHPYPGATFRAVAHENGVWLVAGNGGRCMRSVDGETWAAVDTGIEGTIYALAYGDGTWVAAGQGGAISTSTDNGLTWTRRDFYTGDNLINNPSFELGLEPHHIGNVSNGGTWTVEEDEGAYHGGHVLQYDSDGQTGNANFLFNGNLAAREAHVEVRPGDRLRATIRGRLKSGDSNSVRLRMRSRDESTSGVAVSGGDPTLLTSDWTYIETEWTVPEGDSVYALAYVEVVNDGNVGLHQFDFVRFERLDAFGGADIYSIAYGAGVFVAVGQSGKVATSPNGITWTQRTSGYGANLFGVAFGEGTFAAVGFFDFANPGNAVITSSDGVTWNLEEEGLPGTLNAIAYGGGLWIACGNAGHWSSSDLENWTEESDTIKWAARYADGVWVATGIKILTSTDGDDWAEAGSPFDDGTDSYAYAVGYGDGRWIAAGQQRVSQALVSLDQSVPGRAAYYWDAQAALYFVAGDTVYRGSYGTVIGTISDGTERCYFFALGPDLVLLDPQNGEGWTIDSGGSLSQITDGDFPPNQTPAVPLAHGGAVLNGRLYVLGTDGVIYGSDLEDATSWDALNFVTAERDPDGGTYIGRHSDHVVVMGPRTIEVFYDAANATGSPLSRRQDVAYNMGCNSGESVWIDGDRIWFVGADPSGALGVYVMEGFRLRKVSTGALDSLLTTAITREGARAIGCGFAAHGHPFYALTLAISNEELTLVYDDASKMWGLWDTRAADLRNFPLVSWTIRTSRLPRFGEGIMRNGALITISDTLIPQDGVRGVGYAEPDPGYFAEDYVSEAGGSGSPISIAARTGIQDMGTDRAKFLSQLRVISDRTASPIVCAVRWADGRTDDWSPMRVIDLSRQRALHRLGRFHRRNFEVIYAGPEQVRLEALELTATVGTQ